MLTKVVMTDKISLPGFANLLAFVFLNVSSNNHHGNSEKQRASFPF